MSSVRRTFIALAVTAALAGGLTGCGTGGDQPKVASPISPSATSSAPTSTRTADPKPWEVRSDAGAVAFAKHWVDVFNGAQVSGSTAPLRNISETSCENCIKFAQQIERIYSAGGHIRTSGWRIVAAAPSQGLSPDRARVSVRIHETPQYVVAASTSSENVFQGGNVTYSARISWNHWWKMTDFLAVPQ